MANEPIDVAYVEIRPDLRGFAAAAKVGIAKGLAGVDGNVDLEPGVRGFAAETEAAIARALAGVRALIDIEPNVRGLARETRTAVSRELATVSADLNVHPLLRAFRPEAEAAAEIALRGAEAKIDIDPDLRGFRQETLRGIERELVGAKADVAVGAAAASSGGSAGAAAAGAAGARAATKDVSALGKASEVAKGQVGGLTTGLALLGGSAGRVAAFGGPTAIVAVGAAAGLAAIKSAQAAQQFEAAFAGVEKTVQGSDKELKTLREGFINLSTEIPLTAAEFAKLGEAAGALGVKNDAILGFTKTVAEIGSVSDLSADEAANALARIANITGLPQSQFENLGSAIVKLGLSTASTEPEIAALSLRIAGAGKQIGLSVGDITGFSAALASVGVEAESGGTAISTTFIKIASAVDKGGVTLDRFAQVAGKSTNEFAREFRDKPAQAVIDFIEGLDRVRKEGGSVFQALDSVGLGGIRVRDSLLRASGAGSLFADAIASGNKAFTENTALQDAANKRFDTTAAKVAKAKNEVTALEIAMGDGLNRAIGDAATGFGTLIGDLRRSDDAANLVKEVLDDLKLAFGPLALVIKDLAPSFKDAFGDLARIFSTILFAAKPLITVIGVTLAASFASAAKATTIIIDALDLVASAWRFTVGVVIKAADAFLGALSFLADKANDILPGNPFGGIQGGIDEAREHLRSFGDELDAIGGKTVTATVNVDLQLPALGPTEDAVRGIVEHAQDVAADEVKRAGRRPDEGSRGPAAPSPLPAKPKRTGPPAFGDPDFKPSDKVVKVVDLTDLTKTKQAVAQKLADDVALAKVQDESTANDKRALAAEAKFFDEQAASIAYSKTVRRQFHLKAESDRAEIRAINDAETKAAKASSDASKKDAKDKADAAVAARESILQSNLSIAQATEKTIRDDEAALKALVSFYKRRVGILGKSTAAGKEALAKQKAAEGQLRGIREQDAKDRADARQKRNEARLSRFEDDVTLAKLTRDTKSDDIKALEAERREIKRQIEETKKNSAERRKLKIQLQEVTNDLEDIRKEKQDATAAAKEAFKAQSFSFLQSQTGFISNLLGGLFGSDLKGLVGNAESAAEGTRTGLPTRRPDRPGDVGAGVRPPTDIRNVPVQDRPGSVGPGVAPAEALAVARIDGGAGGLSKAQANQLLALTRQIVDALHGVNSRTQLPESTNARVRQRHAQEGVF